jgi:hypothetical protein
MREWRFSFTILDLGTSAGEWSASRPGRCIPEERALGKHSTGGWVGPRVGLNAVEKRKISCPCWDLNPGRPALFYLASSLESQLLRLTECEFEECYVP